MRTITPCGGSESAVAAGAGAGDAWAAPGGWIVPDEPEVDETAGGNGTAGGTRLFGAGARRDDSEAVPANRMVLGGAFACGAGGMGGCLAIAGDERGLVANGDAVRQPPKSASEITSGKQPRPARWPIAPCRAIWANFNGKIGTA